MTSKLAPILSQKFLGRESSDVMANDAIGSYADNVVLVSGAGGSIGLELCRQIVSYCPTKLVMYELSELALYTVEKKLHELAKDTGVELVSVLGSVADARQVHKILSDHNVDVILHAAAYKHVPIVEKNPLTGLANNVFGTETLAKEAAEFGVKRFILVSSDKAVRPANVMGASKYMAEMVVQDLAARHQSTIFTIVRFGNVLGSSGSIIPLFQEQVSRGGPVTVTDRRMKRYFMTIHEAVHLVLIAGAEATGSKVFVLDMGDLVPIIQMARQVIEANGYQVRDGNNPHGDIEIVEIGLRPGEKLKEELSLTGDLIGTHHRRIFNVQEVPLSEIEVASMLRSLKHALAKMDEDAARATIKNLISRFQEKEPGQVMMG